MSAYHIQGTVRYRVRDRIAGDPLVESRVVAELTHRVADLIWPWVCARVWFQAWIEIKEEINQ